MRDPIKVFLVASSLAFGIPTFVDAEPLDPAPGAKHEMRALRWLRQLQLTDAQRDQIFTIFYDQSAATRERMKLVHRAREALRVAALSPGFDRAQARSLADAAGRAVADMALMRAEREPITTFAHMSLPFEVEKAS